MLVGALGAVALAAPATASGAVIGVLPKKSCYRSGETVRLGGTGYSPNNRVEVTLDRRSLGFASTDAQGAFLGNLRLGTIRGERNRLLAATDQLNPANFGAITIHASGVNVDVRPRRAGPGRRVRVKAYGFTGARRLYAHVRRGRFRRNVRVGRLRRACRKLDRRARIFPLGTRPGLYTVQFDGKRRYSRRTTPAVRFRVTIFRRVLRRGFASASAQSWVRLP